MHLLETRCLLLFVIVIARRLTGGGGGRGTLGGREATSCCAAGGVIRGSALPAPYFSVAGFRVMSRSQIHYITVGGRHGGVPGREEKGTPSNPEKPDKHAGIRCRSACCRSLPLQTLGGYDQAGT